MPLDRMLRYSSLSECLWPTFRLCTFYTKDLNDQEREAPLHWRHWKREATKVCRNLLYHWSMLMQSDKGHGMQQLWSTKESPRNWAVTYRKGKPAAVFQVSQCSKVCGAFVMFQTEQMKDLVLSKCPATKLQMYHPCFFFWGGGWPLLFYEQNHDMGGMDEYPLTLDPDSAPPKLANEIILHYNATCFFPWPWWWVWSYVDTWYISISTSARLNPDFEKRLVLLDSVGMPLRDWTKNNRIWPGTNPSPWAGHHAYSSPRVCVSEIGACMLPRWVEKGHISSQLS